MKAAIGRKCWAIPEGYIPAIGHGTTPELMSHESACILNASDKEARVEITVFFSDKEPIGPYVIIVPPRRTKHIQFNNLKDPQPIPRGTDYSTLFISNVEIVVQHTRLDARQAENALMTTIAFPCDWA